MKHKSFYNKILRSLKIIEPISTIVLASITAFLGFQVNKLSEIQTDIMKKQYDVEGKMEKIAIAEAETNLELKELTVRQNEYIKIQTDIQKFEEERKAINCDVLAEGFIVTTKNQYEQAFSQVGGNVVVPENRIIIFLHIVNNSLLPLSIKNIQFIPNESCNEDMFNSYIEDNLMQYYGLSDDNFIRFINMMKMPITINGYQSVSGEIFFGGKYIPKKDISEGILRFNTNQGIFDKPYTLVKMPGVSKFVDVVKIKKESEMKKKFAEILIQYENEMEEYEVDFKQIYEQMLIEKQN